MKHYVWQSSYEAAMFETQSAFIEIRIAEAENALFDRLEDELHGRCSLDANERQAIHDARKLLAVLRRGYAA